jgi:hypothetical protein
MLRSWSASALPRTTPTLIGNGLQYPRKQRINISNLGTTAASVAVDQGAQEKVVAVAAGALSSCSTLGNLDSCCGLGDGLTVAWCTATLLHSGLLSYTLSGSASAAL